MLGFVTDFGDVAYLLPAVVAVAGYLVYLRAWACAIAWGAAFGGCLALTALLKIVFLTCGSKLHGLDVYSPSGHTSFATTFYLGIGLLASRDKAPWFRSVVMALSIGLAVAIAWSRILLSYHSAAEVGVGALIGVASLSWFAIQYYRHPQPGLALAPVLLFLTGIAVAAHGHHVSGEGWFRVAAAYIRLKWAICA